MESDQSLKVPGLGARRGNEWPAWAGPLALVSGFVLASFGALLIDIPAVIFGVNVSSSHLPGGLEILDTVVQDAVFVFVAVRCARLGGRAARAWQFGLRPTKLWPAALLVVLTLLAFLIFSLLWAAALDVSTKEKVLEQLGANESPVLLVLSATLTCVIAPICEEFLFRGFVFQALRNWRGPWLAALITGLLFGAFHLGSAPAVDLVPLAMLGFALCLLFWRTKSLYPCIAAHALNNSIAYGDLESWRWWQVIVLASLALGLIWLLAQLLKRLRVITPAPPGPSIQPGT